MDTRSGSIEKITEDLKAYISRLRCNSQARLITESDLAELFNVRAKRFQSVLNDFIRAETLVRINGRGIFIPPKNTVPVIHIFVPSDIAETDPYYEKLLKELNKAAVKYSINIIKLEAECIEPAPCEVPLVIIGLIKDKALLEKLLAVYHRVIAVWNCSEYNDRISQIYFNDYKIGRQAAYTLVDYNHRNVLLLAGPDQYPSLLYRKTGFLDAMAERGIKPSIYTEKMNIEGGYHAGEFIMNTIPEAERPTAVFAANDSMAAGLMKKLKEYKVNIPEDISIIGCDDTADAVETEPALTAFNPDTKYLIMELVALINRISASGDFMTQKIVLPAALILRDSLIKNQ